MISNLYLVIARFLIGFTVALCIGLLIFLTLKATVAPQPPTIKKEQTYG